MARRYLALFPGQGSQKVGMGKELNLRSEAARDIFRQADEALGIPLSKICFEGPEDRLTATEVAQPAILTVSYILYRLFTSGKEHGTDFVPIAAAGHSLGEYTALVAAGSLKFEDAVRLVQKRGRFMQEAVPAGEGSMCAVLGKEVDQIETAIASVKSGVVEIANINAPGQIVISGAKSAVQEFKAALPDARIMDLSVSAPFHCSLMKPAQDKLARELESAEIADAAFPVYSNYTAAPVIAASDIRRNLTLQVCGRVRWVESMERAIKETTPDIAVEFGSGTVLTGMLKRISPPTPRLNIIPSTFGGS